MSQNAENLWAVCLSDVIQPYDAALKVAEQLFEDGLTQVELVEYRRPEATGKTRTVRPAAREEQPKRWATWTA